MAHAQEATGGHNAQKGFRVPGMYHPSHDVFDLEAAERWYHGVFGASSMSLQSIIGRLPPRPGSGYPPNYSTFTLIGDVLMDTIDPTRYVIAGVQRLPSIAEPHLRLISWYVDDMEACYRALRSAGIRLTDQQDNPCEDQTAPYAFGSDMKIFYSIPEDAGLRYAFSRPCDVLASDPRSEPGWVSPTETQAGGLGLRFCSHHTILTDRPERALRFLRDVMGGEVFHEGRNDLIGASCSYLFLGDSTIELAVPDMNTPVHADWQKRAPNDTYHALTWLVADLDGAERHLAAQGVTIASRSPETIITDPATSLGIPWGFTTALAPKDPRRARL